MLCGELQPVGTDMPILIRGAQAPCAKGLLNPGDDAHHGVVHRVAGEIRPDCSVVGPNLRDYNPRVRCRAPADKEVTNKEEVQLSGRSDTSILHHAFISIFIALWAVLHVMSQYLCLFSLILQGLHEEGECRQLGFWAGKGVNISDLFCTTPKVLKLHESQFWNILKIGRRKHQRGATHRPRGWRVRPTPWARPLPRGPPRSPPDAHLLV